MSKKSEEQIERERVRSNAEHRIELYRADPERSSQARVASALLRGEWLTAHEVVERYGVASPSTLGQVVQTLREAGEHVVSRAAGPNGLQAFSVQASKRKPATQHVEHELAGVTHPQLGQTLTVRALVLDADGELIVSLSNGSAAWTAKITGHVG